jgi:hypothetical protein
LQAQLVYKDWLKYLGDSKNNVWQAVKYPNDTIANTEPSAISVGPYANMYSYLQTNVFPVFKNGEGFTISNVTTLLIRKTTSTSTYVNNDYNLMMTATQGVQDEESKNNQIQALNFLSDITAGDPTNQIMSVMKPVQYLTSCLIILMAYALFHLSFGNTKTNNYHIVVAICILLIILGIVKMYSQYK